MKLKLALIFVGLLALGRLVSSPLPQASAPVTPTPKAETELDVSSAQSDAEDALRDKLRDPDSFKVVKWRRYGPASRKYPPRSQVWGLTYRAKNGFGGMNVEEKLFVFGPKVTP